LHFEVVDTGIGIPANKLDQLFSPFVQADTSTTRKYGGTGLGLSIAKRLAELMGGEIGVSSIEGTGSTFWLDLPFAIQGDSRLKPPSDSIQLRGKRILVVDDSPTNRRLMEILLRSWSCEPLLSEDGAKALQFLNDEVKAQRQIDAVILDMQMPGLSGEQIGHKIREDKHLAGIPLILLTSVSNRGDARRVSETGFNAYLSKPVRDKLLKACLLNIFGQSNGDRELALDTLITRHTLAEQAIHARILLVEDNETNQKLAVSLLKKFGHQVTVANNGQEALSCLSSEIYDLVLMDCRMPVMNGFEATNSIRHGQGKVLNPNVTIIAMTANAMEGDREEVIAAGMNDYLTKPIRPDILNEMLKRWLNGEAIADLPQTAIPSSVNTNDGLALENVAVFNPNLIIDLLGDDTDLICALLSSGILGCNKELENLEGALTTGDGEAICRATHTIKGLGSTLGSPRIEKVSKRMEIAGRSGNFVHIRDQLGFLAAAIKEFSVEAELWMESLDRTL
jgi:CheY-like chemotaxis protein/HPt (histidine-containing phosphotransfer) domain-containing protein